MTENKPKANRTLMLKQSWSECQTYKTKDQWDTKDKKVKTKPEKDEQWPNSIEA